MVGNIVYQIQGYVEFQERPNVEVIYEHSVIEMVNEVLKIIKRGEFTEQDLEELDQEGVCLDEIQGMRITGVYKVEKICD